jgi:hypothetical protein
MSYRELIYWRRGFSYDRKNVGDRIAIETYRILMHYTSENRNCRVGAYLSKTWFSEFYSLQQLFPDFETFINIATSDKKIVNSDAPQIFKDLNGVSFYEEIESVMKLKWPIYFEFQSQSLINKIFGYNFKNAMSLMIEPDDIISLEGESLDSFRIKIKDFVLDIRFRNQICIK